jgi:hypothetical protein
MAATKFFHLLAKPIPTTIGMRSPKRSGDKQEIPITFRIALDGNNVRSAPPFVRSAYEEINNGADSVGLKKEIENVNVEIYNLPEAKKASFRLPRLHLQKLAVKETANSEGDTQTVLAFETLYPYDSAVWKYLGEHYSITVFLRFDSAQASLLDEEDLSEGEDVQAEIETEAEEVSA